ncbi:hypothetical protein M407DRAFT_28404 [Tulasnella calospora MUT 4182]|uniref:Beta-glucuronidase C-terminal domain-containing protein n=1 Tax=Tulasnella calospora MUT 4182 TaxID=1051891 RepID=A0A0C3QC40_9AGAM|nr:hypothetical protein M407DRAFT_28404 [Tulasnella calospora MUT 4182]
MSRGFLLFALLSAFFTPFAIAQVNLTYPSNVPDGVIYVDDNYFGISWELQVVNLITSGTPDTIPVPLQNYLKNVRARMSNPLRMRIGGNSMDNSYYVPAQVPMINGTVDNVNYTPITYGPMFLDTIVRLGDIIGGSQWDVGLGLVHVADGNNTVNLAVTAAQKLGGRLDAFLLGNEPDLYTTHGLRPGQANYTVQNYIDDYANLLGQIHSIPELVNVPMGGPTICCFWDLYTLLANGYLGAFRNYLKYLTIQHYPQNNCFDRPPTFDIGYYTNHANVVGLSTWNLQGVQLAQQSGLNVSMSEFNSVSCGGLPGVSNTFAALLWTIDYALQLASLGYTSAYIHTREPGVTYNLFDPPAANLDQNTPGWTTGAPYHSLLFVTEALHSDGAKGMAVVDVQAPSPTTAANSVAAYAIYPTPNPSIARMPPTRFVIINYAANGPLNFQFNQNNTGVNPTTGGIMSIGTVIVKQLTSSSLTTNANITWGGQVVDGGGNLQGTVANNAVNGCGSATGCTISVPGPGAVIVYLDSPDSSISNAPNTTGTNGANPDASETSTEEVPAASFDPGYLNGNKARHRFSGRLELGWTCTIWGLGTLAFLSSFW